ncbi:MAG: TRAM domain-containing protein [Calditrichota bacterium]
MKHHTILITDLTAEGKGVGRLEDGRVAFIQGAIPGDRVDVKIASSHSHNPSEITFVRLTQPSPKRIEHPCPHNPLGCPASPLGVWDYQAALAWKRDHLAQVLKRIGGLPNPPIDSIIPSPQKWAYRNRIELTLQCQESAWRMGYLSAGILNPVKRCLLAAEPIQQAMAALNASLPKAIYSLHISNSMDIRLLLLDDGANRCVGILFITNQAAKLADWVNWLTQSPLKGWEIRTTPSIMTRFQKAETLASNGEVLIEHKINGIHLQSSAGAFSQANESAAASLRQIVGERLAAGSRIADFYGGWGAFAIHHALKGGSGWVLEYSSEAIETGRRAAAGANLPVTYRRVDLSKRSSLHSFNPKLDAVILDPPRKGLSDSVIQWLNAVGPRLVVYVSCHPAALARDIHRLEVYQPVSFIPVDMFPQTPDIETVATLERMMG